MLLSLLVFICKFASYYFVCVCFHYLIFVYLLSCRLCISFIKSYLHCIISFYLSSYCLCLFFIYVGLSLYCISRLRNPWQEFDYEDFTERIEFIRYNCVGHHIYYNYDSTTSYLHVYYTDALQYHSNSDFLCII